MASVIEADERISEVHIEGLALLKIAKHCQESLPHMVTGSLLGMAVAGTGTLEITHAFAFPDTKHHHRDQQEKDDEDAGMEGHEFQLEMMRMLREVNVDNNCVGWYQSMYLGIFSTTNLLDNQWSYQTDLSPNAVVLLYDPLQTSHGNLLLKCFRLSEECIRLKEAMAAEDGAAAGSNDYIDPQSIFEEIPVKLTNPGLARAMLATLNAQQEAAVTTTSSPDAMLRVAGSSTTFDRLDLSTNPYLEKHLEYMCNWVDDLAAEQGKFQYYSRQLARARDARYARKFGTTLSTTPKAESWAASEAPRRLESLLIANQIESYCTQMDQFTSDGLSKLYLMGNVYNDTKGQK